MVELACGISSNGVYRIVNINNNKCYIGSCAEKRGFRYRWLRHQNQLRQNEHHSTYLQRAWNKYGAEAFEFNIILVCDPKHCLDYEQLALDHYNPEYNMCHIVGSRLGVPQSAAVREKIRQAKIGERNPAYGKRGSECHNSKLTQQMVDEIRDWLQYWPDISQCDIAKMYDVSDNHISLIRRRLIW